MMAELMRWNRDQEEKLDLHPLIHASLFHHKFLTIHPFDDGNGRLARILMNLILMRHGYPPVVVKLAARDSYVAALRRADAGETEGIVRLLGQNLVDAETLYLRGAKGESIEDLDDVDKEVALLKQELFKAPKPVELRYDLQVQLFVDCLSVLFDKIDHKLAQFDEMFAVNSVTVAFGIHGGVDSSFSPARSRINQGLLDLLKDGKPLREVTIFLRWEGFVLDGTNDFSISLELKMRFEQRKWIFECRETQFSRLLLYQTWFSNDEINQLVSALAKAILDQIRSRRTKPVG
jgi:hypothetical protein